MTCYRCGLRVRVGRHRFSGGRQANRHFRCTPDSPGWPVPAKDPDARVMWVGEYVQTTEIM